MRILGTALLILACAGTAHAADPVKRVLTLRDHRFEPAEISAPPDVPIQIMVNNTDATAEEFESGPLAVEKVIAGGRSAIVRLPPQQPGRYPFIGEFHAETAKGLLVIANPP